MKIVKVSINNKTHSIPVEDLDVVEFKSPKQTERHMDRIFGVKSKVHRKTKWFLTEQELDKKPVTSALKSSAVEFWAEEDHKDFLSLKIDQHPFDVMMVEIDYNWFFKRNLKKELNGFQVFVGQLVGIL